MAKSNILITFAVGKVHRDVAQLVARHVRDVEVGSSSLLIPTNKQGDVLSKDLFSTSFLYLLRRGGLNDLGNHCPKKRTKRHRLDILSSNFG